MSDAAKSRRRLRQPIRLLQPGDMSGIGYAIPANANANAKNKRPKRH